MHRDTLHACNSLRDIVDDENALATFLEQSLNTDRFIPGELPIRMPDGAVINVPVEGSRLGNGQEGLVVRFGAASRCFAFDTVNSRFAIEDAASRRDDDDARGSSDDV